MLQVDGVYNGRHTFPRDFIVGDWPWKGEVLHADVPCLGSIKVDVVDNGSIHERGYACL